MREPLNSAILFEMVSVELSKWDLNEMAWEDKVLDVDTARRKFVVIDTQRVVADILIDRPSGAVKKIIYPNIWIN